MSAAAERSRREIMKSFVGKSARVICEQPESGGFGGYTDRYLPAVVSGGGLFSGAVAHGTITAVENGKCIINNALPVIR